MFTLTSKHQKFTLAIPLSAGSLKRSRTFDKRDAEDANLQRGKRAIVAAPGRPEGEADTARTICSPRPGTDPIPTNEKEKAICDDDDVSMFDCNINDNASIEKSEVEESSSNHGDICFGTICDAKAAVSNENQLDEIGASTLLIESDVARHFSISHSQGCYCLQSRDGRDFAILHSRTATALQTLQDLPSSRFEAIIGGENTKTVDQKDKKGKFTVFSTSINIYGSETIFREVGKRLSKVRAYLQHPISLKSGVPYNNPHFYATPHLIDYVPPPCRKLEQQDSILDIAKVFEEVDHGRELRSQNADWLLRTALLEHQKEALHFIIQRENVITDDIFSLWKAQHNDDGKHYYQHAILGSRSREKPLAHRGGILADDMGLGKTLTMISAIAMLLTEAREFAGSQHDVQAGSGNTSLRRTSSTLVIAPSAVLLDSWEDEIRRHVNPGLLKVYKYHGIGKEIDINSIIGHDVVVTTYATIASDVTRRSSPLQQIKWFRVVLDEAHSIRHQSTQQFRAVNSLHAERRWCLTGTPIQNRLEDLGSLIRFLRVFPSDSNATFRTHISEPLLTEPGAGDGNLRLLLKSMCLRRTRVLLILPNAENQTITLSLSTEERCLYSQIIEDTKRSIDDCISSRSITKAYNGIFQAILRLRLLCNNGTRQFSKSGSAFQGGFTEDGYVEGDRPSCIYCSCENILADSQIDGSPGASPQNPPQLLCPACLSPNDTDKTSHQKKPRKQQPTSRQHVQQIKINTYTSSQPYGGERGSSDPLRPSCIPNGHSSKLSALVSNIQGNILGSKSIVFSCWKKTLDLLESMLENVGTQYVRIDGAIPTIERNKIIKRFQEDPEINLLLMTTGTGAVGLNLTAANRVHLLEPQWNPAIEAQAIGRALRLGQTRNVTIIRYVMKETIEEAIQSRQIMKLQLAELTLEKKEGNEQTMLQRLKDLRSLLHKY